MSKNSFFIVEGINVDDDFSNVTTMTSKVIPITGDIIQLKGKILKVTNRLINYTQVEDYDNIKDHDRGGEMVYVFVKNHRNF